MNAQAVRETPKIVFPDGLECRIFVEGTRCTRSFKERAGGSRVTVRVREQHFRSSRTGANVTVIEVVLSGCTLITPRDEVAPDNTVRWVRIGGRSAPWFFRPGPDCRMDELSSEAHAERTHEDSGHVVGI